MHLPALDQPLPFLGVLSQAIWFVSGPVTCGDQIG